MRAVRALTPRQREAELPPGLLSDPHGNGFGRSLEWPFDSARYLGESHYRERLRAIILHDRRYAINWHAAAAKRRRELDQQLLPVRVYPVNRPGARRGPYVNRRRRRRRR